MKASSDVLPRARRAGGFALLFLAVAFASSDPAAAQSCVRSGCAAMTCGSPATPVPSNLWDELEAADVGPTIPGDRDSTAFNEFTTPEWRLPWFSSVDVENGWIFTTNGYGMTVWDGRTDPVSIVRSGSLGNTSFAYMPGGEDSTPVQDLDAPAGVDDRVALSGYFGFGVAVVDTSSKGSPRVAYQDSGKGTNEVYAARIGGTDYAFAAVPQSGLVLYDMTKALTYNNCSESWPGAVHCSGVVKGAISVRTGAQYVDGVGNYVVTSYASSKGFEIYDVSNPLSAQLKLSGLADQPIYGVALWKESTKYYLALATSSFVPGVGNQYEGRIYDVSCIAGSCGALGSPLDSMTIGTPSVRSFVTFSRSGSRPFVHFGNDNRCAGGTREYLVDVSDPHAMRDISPAGYWAFTTRWNRLWPGRAKFYNDYLYRAANSVFDVHHLAGGSPPSASFTHSSPVYAGFPASFTDTSTGLVNGRTWTFPGGTPSSSSASTVNVTFASPGSKSVNLHVTNNAGSDDATQNVSVVDPTPSIASITASPAAPNVCQPVTFTATASGPSLGYAWSVKEGNNDSGGNQVASGSANPLLWSRGTIPAAGTYTAFLTVSNTQGQASSSLPITLAPAPDLVTPVISNETFSYGSVIFHATIPGASEWRWDFDGNGFGDDAWTAVVPDGQNQASVTHQYTSTGTRNVVLQVRNCANLGGATSNVLPINITQVDPLVAKFRLKRRGPSALAPRAPRTPAPPSPSQTSHPAIRRCTTTRGTTRLPVPALRPTTTAAMPRRSYDAHLHARAGSYHPCLKITRGNEVSDFPHAHLDRHLRGQPGLDLGERTDLRHHRELVQLQRQRLELLAVLERLDLVGGQRRLDLGRRDGRVDLRLVVEHRHEERHRPQLLLRRCAGLADHRHHQPHDRRQHRRPLHLLAGGPEGGQPGELRRLELDRQRLLLRLELRRRGLGNRHQAGAHLRRGRLLPGRPHARAVRLFVPRLPAVHGEDRDRLPGGGR